jgi:polysaccharide export outer membrane protein
MARASPAIILVVAIAAAGAQAQEAPALRMSSSLTLDRVQERPAPVFSDPAALQPISVAPGPTDTASRMGIGEYRIGAEDLLEVQVFGIDQLARTVRVNSFGMVSLPLIGPTSVGGMTAQEAEKVIARRLAENYLQDPQVSVFIKEYTNQRVTLEGAVAKPGIYPLRGETTLLRALAVAGGQGSLSDLANVVVYRSDASGLRTSQIYDLEKIRRGESEDPKIVNDDVIVVNRSPARVVFKDSLFRDILDAINPFSYIPK